MYINTIVRNQSEMFMFSRARDVQLERYRHAIDRTSTMHRPSSTPLAHNYNNCMASKHTLRYGVPVAKVRSFFLFVSYILSANGDFLIGS